MEICLLFLLGVLIGTIGSIVGVGGGFILLPVLLYLYPSYKPDALSSITLAVVLFNSISGFIAYFKMKRIDVKTGIAFGLATIPGSILGALTNPYIPVKTFKIILGILLICIAIYFLFFRNKIMSSKLELKKGTVDRDIEDSNHRKFNYSFDLYKGIIASVLIGFISSLIGIGGGVIQIPVMIGLLGIPVEIATATSQLILIFMSLAGTTTRLFTGTLEFTILIPILSIGAIIGAQIGAYSAKKMNTELIVKIFGITAIASGIKMIIG